MKVLFLTNVPSPYRVDFFNELGKYCELTVLFERRNASDRDKKWQSAANINFKSIFLNGVNVGNDSALNLSVLKYLNKNYNLIVIGGYSTPTGMLAIIYLNLKKIPFILNTDGGFIKEDKKIIYLMKKYFISSANAWLSTADKTTDYLIHYGAKKDKIYKYPFSSVKTDEVLQNPLSSQEKTNIKKVLNIKEEKVVISVGQFIYRKGYDVLLNACKDVSEDIGIYIIGGKPTEEYLKIKNELQLKNVYFIDFKTKEILTLYYRAADLFVFPTREDIWGLVVNEAMSYGLPVITTDRCVAGLELIREGSNGFIVPIEDIDELAFKIKVILEDNELRENMKKESLKTISKYTIEEMSIRHLEIFQDIKRK